MTLFILFKRQLQGAQATYMPIRYQNYYIICDTIIKTR